MLAKMAGHGVVGVGIDSLQGHDQCRRDLRSLAVPWAAAAMTSPIPTDAHYIFYWWVI
jgi:hypothetical protein